MSVRARFWIRSVTKTLVSGSDISRTVDLAPVVRPTGVPGADGNVDWAKYTPSGEIRLQVNAEAAGAWFEEHLGRDVAITFDEIPDGE